MSSDYDDGINDQDLLDLINQTEFSSLIEDDAAVQPSLDVTIDCSDGEHGLVSREEILALEAARHSIGKTPYERFRSSKGYLSVTDLVSPAWCESQFEYTLEKSGRKRRTRAMREGHKKHAALELEVHEVTIVALDETIKEEILGLRLLNMITALGELYSTNLTREMPIFGFYQDMLVHGVIDELQSLPVNADHISTVDAYFGTALPRKIVISDAKTRVNFSQPSLSQTAQSKHQVMLYLQLARQFADLDIDSVLRVYGYDGHRTFSDSFIAQSLNINIGLAIEAMSTIAGLWAHIRPMMKRLQHELSDDCRLLYIHQQSNSIIAQVPFRFDAKWLAMRTQKVLAWWHGRRAAEGVPIEEAGYKCSTCEMTLGCTWRINKAEEIYRAALTRRQAHC